MKLTEGVQLLAGCTLGCVDLLLINFPHTLVSLTVLLWQEYSWLVLTGMLF